MRHHDDYTEPTAADLAAIEDEGPLISAELAWFAAEVELMDRFDQGQASVLDVRRVRRAEHAVIRETFAYTIRQTRSISPRHAA